MQEKKIKKNGEIPENTEEVATAKHGKGKRIVNIVINVVLVIAIILAAICTYTSYVSTSGNGVPSIFGIRVMSIQTESMYPTLNPGDLIFDTAVKDPSTLKVGDIITYWTIIDGERVLNTHRITSISNEGHYIFTTRGDNNSIDDSMNVHEAEIVGQYKGAKIGGLGKLFDYLQTSTGFLIVVVIPVAIFFLFHLIQFFRVLFEYQNVKNKLSYEQERGKNEDIVEEEKRRIAETKNAERARLEAELREQLKAEILANNGEDSVKKEETPEEMEARIRAEMEAEAKAKASAAEKEAALRAKIKAQMESETNAEEKAPAEEETPKE